MILGKFAGVVAVFKDEQERTRQEYDEGYADGTDKVSPSNEGEHYIDGYLDAVAHRAPLRP